MVLTLFGLLFLFQIKHFLADYPLQVPYMLGKFKKEGWVLPLFLHTLVHGLLTATITLAYTNDLFFSIFLCLIDMTAHGIMDRIKASPNLLGQFKPLHPDRYKDATFKEKVHNWLFWNSLGLDQMFHHLTHYFLIFMILAYMVQTYTGKAI